MQSPAADDSEPSSTFAGVLSALARPARPGGAHPSNTRRQDDRATDAETEASDRSLTQIEQPSPKWADDLLADDVATLSYERALRAHSRYRPQNLPLELPLDPADVPAAVDAGASAPALEPEPAPSSLVAAAKLLKEASITIRLSRDENEQLRRRAKEAGLSVSAYIRSCTFEADALRAMVKDTLHQLRMNGGSARQEPVRSERRRRWHSLFWPGRRLDFKGPPDQA